MTEAKTGIKTTTTVEVSWYDLGLHLASLNSIDQCALLDGFASGIHSLGAVDASFQIGYIANGVYGYTEWLVDELAANFAEREKK